MAWPGNLHLPQMIQHFTRSILEYLQRHSDILGFAAPRVPSPLAGARFNAGRVTSGDVQKRDSAIVAPVVSSSSSSSSSNSERHL